MAKYSNNTSPAPKMFSDNNTAYVWIDTRRCVVKVKAPFNASFNTMNRGLEGRAWIPSEKYWEFNLQAIPELLKALMACGYTIKLPPLEIMEIFSGFDKEDLELVYRAIVRTKMYSAAKELVDTFFKNYINISDAYSKLGRMIRVDLDPDDDLI